MFELGDAVGFFLYNMNIKANDFKAINKTAETPFLIEEDLNLDTTRPSSTRITRSRKSPTSRTSSSGKPLGQRQRITRLS